MKQILFILSVLFSTVAYAGDKVTITVKNGVAETRVAEMVEVPEKDVAKKLGCESFIVTDSDGREIPSQVTYDGKVIFQVGVGSKGKSVYYAVPGTSQKYERRVAGRLFHERGTEFGWENDRVAYRIYGGGAAVGYDIFNKSTSRLMLDWWYASEQDGEMRSVVKKLRERGFADLADEVYNAFCYHINHGQGMDCYTVGPTLGGGADALVGNDGSLTMPKCYEKYEILDNGPLRFTVRLSYPEVEYDGRKVKETRIVSLDAGSNFNRVTVSFEGLESACQIASGVVVHRQNPNAFVLSKDGGYVGYEDLGDVGTYSYIPKKYHDRLEGEMGRIYVGTVYPDRVERTEFQEYENGVAIGHVLGISQLKGNFTYYFGTVWDGNKELNISSLKDWEKMLSKKVAAVRNPLKVTIR